MASSLLFPDPPRTFPGQRWIKITARAIHVLCAGIATGAYLLAGGDPGWLWATVATGVLLLLIDLHQSAAFLCEVRGLLVLGKLGLLSLWPVLGDNARWLLPVLIVVSVISSHAPGSFRHHLVFRRGKVTPSTSHG